MSNDIKQQIQDTGKNIRDSVDETVHDAKADAERERRDIEGREITTGERIGSTAEEIKERGKAEIDHAKRDLRGDPTA